MPGLSKFLVAGLAAQASGLVLTAPAWGSRTVSRTATLSMNGDATRDPSPRQSFDNDMSGWKPPSGGGGGHAMGGDASKFEATDTGDFAPEEGSDLDALSKGISYTDGMSGSRAPAPCALHSYPRQRACPPPGRPPAATPPACCLLTESLTAR
jgi:hypothetical protein